MINANAVTFVQDSSLVRRLRAVMYTVSIFFLLGFLGHYLSSLPFLHTLQRVNEANKVLNFTSQAIELLHASKKNLEEVFSDKDLITIRFAFRENQKILKQGISTAIRDGDKFPETVRRLIAAQSAIGIYENSAEEFLENLMSNPTKKDKVMVEQLTSELLAVKEFHSDAKEQLLKAQISIKRISDNSFQSVYDSRFLPIIVAVIMSLLFFSFVVSAGFSITKRIRDSIANFTRATDVVATGNLNYRAPILRQDEIGKLTNNFNEMVSSLRGHQEKLAQLQRDHLMQRLREERERTELILKNAERINALIQHSLDAVVGMNEQGIITSWNPQAEMIFGWDKKNAIDHDLASLIIPLKYRKALQKGLDKYLSTGVGSILNQRIELNALRRGGVEFPVELAVTPIQENSSRLFYAFIRDISDRKKFEQQQKALLNIEHHAREVAEQTVNMQDDFLSIAAHELKTPITPISMRLQLLERAIVKETDTELQTIKDQNLLRLTHNSKQEVDRLAMLIDELLDISRISGGHFILNLEEVNLSKIAQSQIDRHQTSIAKTGSVLHTQIEAGVVGFWDSTRLESCVQNLLTNAIKYGKGKPIELKVETRGKSAILTVQDHGIGISKEDQKKIFKKFQRAVSVKDYSGFGLGLYITSEIVKAHGGSIKLESEPQLGSTFVVELPLRKLS